MKSIEDADIKPNTKVFVRCDLDVPVENGKITDTFRLDKNIDTLNILKEKNVRIIIAGHMDRPGGKVQEKYSTEQLRPYFDEKIGAGNYELLENLRFNPGEETNSEDFAKDLASKAEVYVNDSFGNSHREHASMVSLPKLLDSYAGVRLQKEVEVLSKLAKSPDKPLVAIIGGAKIETKKPVIQKFLNIADQVLVGGRLGIGWDEEIPGNLHIPSDYERGEKDIGVDTIKEFNDLIRSSRTIVWSGPLGKFEEREFENGTREIAQAVATSKAYKIVGGGDTIASLKRFGLLDRIDFVSTGGGAMLEFLVKGTLPGLEAIGYDG